MSCDMRKGVFSVNASSKDPDQPAKIYSLIKNLCSTVPNDSISGH